MILTRPEGALQFQPIKTSSMHMALTKYSRIFDFIPFVFQSVPEIKQRYLIEADLPTGPHKGPLLQQGPIATPAGITQYAYRATHSTREAQWSLQDKVTPFLEHKNNPKYSQLADRFENDIRVHLRRMGEQIATEIISRTPPAAAGDLGGVIANLAGWDVDVPSFPQGYEAAISTQQTVVVGGTLLNVGDRLDLLNRAIGLVKGGSPTCIIAPERFVHALSLAAANRSAQNMRFFYEPAVQLDPTRQGVTAPYVTYNGIPICPVSDDLYQAAGHSTVGFAPGAADYDLFIVRAGFEVDNAAYVAFNGEIEAMDEAEVVTSSDPDLPLGTGITLSGGERLKDVNGVYNATSWVLEGSFSFQVMNPQAVAVVSGVQD